MKIGLLIIVLVITNGLSDNSLQDDIKTLHKELYRNYWPKNSTFKFMRSWDHI